MKIGLRILGVAALTLVGFTASPHAAKADGYCREYTRNVVIGGREQEAYGTACRGPDGQWRITSEDVNGQPAQQAQPVNDQVVIQDNQPQVVYVDDSYPGYYAAPYYYDPAPPVVFGVDYWGGRGWHGGGYGGGWHGGYGGGYRGGYRR